MLRGKRRVRLERHHSINSSKPLIEFSMLACQAHQKSARISRRKFDERGFEGNGVNANQLVACVLFNGAQSVGNGLIRGNGLPERESRNVEIFFQ